MDIQHVQNVVSILTLAILAVWDIRKKYVPGWILLPYIMTGIVTTVITRSVETLLISCVPGISFIIISFLTKEKIGYGDGLMTLGLGVWNGIGFINIATLAAMLFLGVVALILYLFLRLLNKELQDIRIPYAPFLFVGALLGVAYA